MIYLYAIAERLTGLPDTIGLDGEPLTLHSLNGFELVVSEHSTAAIEATEEAVLTHAEVVEALLPLADALLPARFGRAYQSVGALEDATNGHEADVRQALDRVRGRVELGLRVVGSDLPSAPQAQSGRAYLESRRAVVAELERLAGDLHEPLAALARASNVTAPQGPHLLLTGAYLVDPTTIPAFRSAVCEIEAAHPRLTFALTGPWPPYSFAEVNGA